MALVIVLLLTSLYPPAAFPSSYFFWFSSFHQQGVEVDQFFVGFTMVSVGPIIRIKTGCLCMLCIFFLRVSVTSLVVFPILFPLLTRVADWIFYTRYTWWRKSSFLSTKVSLSDGVNLMFRKGPSVNSGVNKSSAAMAE
jgi:hypothetical protein